jgi:type I restriction enzyme S subunit
MIKEINIPNGWKEIELGNLGTFSKGKGLSKSELKDGGYPCIRYGEIYTKHDIKIKEFYSFIDEDSAKNSKKVQLNDLLFAGSGETLSEIGKCVSYNLSHKAYVGSDIIILRFSSDVIISIYASYFINSIGRKQLNKMGSGNSVVHIYAKDLEKVKIVLPPLQEQKAIADILEKWDEAIEKTSKLIAAKKKRFEWVRKFSLTTKKDWENIKLKDFLIESNQKSQIENEYKILSSTMNSVEIRSGRVDAVSNIGYKIIRRNQLVLSPQNLWLGNINVNTDYEVGLVSPSYKIFDFNENIILSDFAKFLFKTNKMLWNYKLCSEAGASVVRRNLDLNLFYEIKIFIPALEQQKQIAKTLNTAKKEITILEEILGKYKSQKKGLMQKLLTGKIRVK